MIHVLNALDKLAAFLHHLAGGGSPLGLGHLAKGALDDLVKARETVTTTETVTEDEVPEGDAPAGDDNSADALNAAEADANAQRAAAMAAGMAHS